MIPLLTAFPLRSEGVVESLELTSCIVWIIDIVATFLRGFINPRTGFVEMRLKQITLNYLTGWFVPDLAMLSSDIMSLFALDLRTVETLTLLRLFRNLRLFRLLKMAGRLSLIKELVLGLNMGLEWTSLYVETILTVLKHVSIIALLCHFTACAWYALGDLSSDEMTWIATYREKLNLPEETGWSFFYALSLHWALTQFTPAAMDVVAVNTPERLFSLFATLSGLIMFSFFIGSINQSLARFSTLTAQEVKTSQMVRRYVTEKRVSVELSADILRCIRQRGIGRETSKVVFGDIPALKHLPDKVRSALKQEVGMPILETHGMIRHATLINYGDVAPLCANALQELSVVYREELFQAGAKGELMYFVRDGKLAYSWDETPHLVEDVLPDMRVSEAVLWLNWEYRGRLGCGSQSAHIFQLDGDGFRKVIARSTHMDLFALYARLFVKMISDCYNCIEEEATDLFGDDEQVSKMLRLSSLLTAGNDSVDIRAVFLAWKGEAAAAQLPLRQVRRTLLCVPRLARALFRFRRQSSPSSHSGGDDDV
ncbi:unc-103 [Symbiodinium sp. KB8]|nr:unc-103 [Symbiodinium sp. KB8]